MPIRMHPTQKLKTGEPWPDDEVYAMVVQCDDCPTMAKKPGKDIGDAAEKAYKEGFDTISNGVGKPKKWVCPPCKQKAVFGEVRQPPPTLPRVMKSRGGK